jgi:DNA-binding MarR family transcriptional regulator
MPISTLSEYLGIGAQSTTELVDTLERDRLVRSSVDGGDRGEMHVSLTGKGADINRMLTETRAVEANAFFGRVAEPDRHVLARILHELQQQ